MMGSGGGGGLGSSSSTGGATQQNLQQMGGAAEAASPISSIPPAAMPHNFSMSTSTSTGGGGGSNYNFDEDMLMGGGASGDMNELGGGGDGGGGGNRWPRQETLALIKIRSEMDVAFRDATLKGPLWDHVSRKLGELGYKRSAKKCKEKFENVHKYYKRTKEGRAGRQDGKSYRFFTELEALHGTNIPTAFSSGPAVAAVSNTTSLQPVADPIPVSVGFGQLMPPVISSTVQVQAPPVPPPRVGASVPSDSSTAPALVFTAPAAATAPLQYVSPATFGVSFSSEGTSSSSYSSDSEEDDDNPMDLEGGVDGREPAAHDPAVRHQHKRKRSSSLKGPHQHLHSSSNTNRERMMEFFEGLMKQVMQKQEAMQQRFLEAIEKREQDRMIRLEAWKRQEMARLAREHELLSQERAVSASRDAAIVSFLQKITGQTIQLPPPATNPAASAAAVPVYRPPPSPPQPPPSSQQYHKLQQPAQNYFPQQQEHQPQRSQQIEQLSHQPQQRNTQIAATTEKNQPSAPISSSLEMIVAVPNQGLPTQEIGSTAVAVSVEATSSRWPKTEVLALIKLRSTLEPRYQEAGPKGPLWEEISAGMHRMGYKRSSKRCKEKWENINKYFKKVKESNKQRPEDAKTCPYFHELDALYQKKILGSGSSTATGVNTIVTGDQVQQQQQVKEKGMRIDTKFQDQGQVPTAMAPIQTKITARSETKDGSSNDLQITMGGFTASLFGEGSDDTGVAEGAKKPESIVKEQQPQNHHRQLMTNEYGDTEKLDDDNLQQEDDEYNDDDELDEDDEAEEETKMAYTIQFQRQNTGSSNGGGTGAPSFLAMVQ